MNGYLRMEYTLFQDFARKIPRPAPPRARPVRPYTGIWLRALNNGLEKTDNVNNNLKKKQNQTNKTKQDKTKQNKTKQNKKTKTTKKKLNNKQNKTKAKQNLRCVLFKGKR